MVGGTWYQQQQESTNAFALYQNTLAQSDEYLTCVMKALTGQVELYDQQLMQQTQLDKFNGKVAALYGHLLGSCTTYNCAGRWQLYKTPTCSHRPQLHHAAAQRPQLHGKGDLHVQV